MTSPQSETVLAMLLFDFIVHFEHYVHRERDVYMVSGCSVSAPGIHPEKGEPPTYVLLTSLKFDDVVQDRVLPVFALTLWYKVYTFSAPSSIEKVKIGTKQLEGYVHDSLKFELFITIQNL